MPIFLFIKLWREIAITPNTRYEETKVTRKYFVNFLNNYSSTHMKMLCNAQYFLIFNIFYLNGDAEDLVDDAWWRGKI